MVEIETSGKRRINNIWSLASYSLSTLQTKETSATQARRSGRILKIESARCGKPETSNCVCVCVYAYIWTISLLISKTQPVAQRLPTSLFSFFLASFLPYSSSSSTTTCHRTLFRPQNKPTRIFSLSLGPSKRLAAWLDMTVQGPRGQFLSVSFPYPFNDRIKWKIKIRAQANTGADFHRDNK